MSSSPRLLFIHGLIGFLQPDLRIISGQTLAPDMLGYGELATVDPAQISLHAQVEYLYQQVNALSTPDERWYLVGHSVGGAIAALFAATHPERVAAVISVEGNFTLDDAFWSQQLAKMPLADVEARLAADRAAPEKWLAGAGVVVNEDTLRTARACLAFQPASTLQRVAASVVAVTAEPAYLEAISGWIEHIPLHLIAGERSAGGWHVPDWVRAQAASDHQIAGCGHLMMLENPEGFYALVQEIVEDGERR